jgi:lysyl-tRNA synthetase, class II
MAASRLELMRQQRIDKMKQLEELGIQTFPARSQRDYTNAYVTAHFDELNGKDVTLVGRIVSFRGHGKISFVDIEDSTGKFQLSCRADEQEPLNVEQQTLGFDQLNLLDTGDFVQARGTLFVTTAGQQSLLVRQLKLLTKSLRPLPNARDLASDPDFIFRRRYADLATNPDRRAMFERKAAFWRENRAFLHQEGFIEVETPVLEHVTGGADARPFTTHMNALDQEFYLRISTELYQKRLIGGGFEKIFTVGPNFRNEGLSDEHLPEYNQVEWYWAYADYNMNMELVERMFKHLAQKVWGKSTFSTRGHTFDLNQPWEKISYPDVIKERYGVDIFTTPDAEMAAILRQHKVKLTGEVNRSRLIDNLWKLIRKEISGPAFLINEPAFMSPLSKSRADKPELTERFHVLIAGSELGNGYSELNNPIEQLARFKDQQAMREQGDDEAQMLDIDYVEMLEYGMPPTSGYGHSERVFWFLEDVTARQGTLFPALKRSVSAVTRSIYNMPDTSVQSKKADSTQKAKAPKTSAPATAGLPPRAQAEALLEDKIKNEALRHHSRMVAQALEAYARALGEDPELWYQTGLLHDLDWETFPKEHPNKAIAEWLNDYPEELRQAIAAHAPDRTGKQPETLLEKYTFACDELSGFMHAVSLMRPNGWEGMEPKSIKKKLKDKGFAANVSRSDIEQGFSLIGKTADEHIGFLIKVFEK